MIVVPVLYPSTITSGKGLKQKILTFLWTKIRIIITFGAFKRYKYVIFECKNFKDNIVATGVNDSAVSDSFARKVG